MAKRGHLYYILLLAALGAYVFNIVQEGAELSQIAAEKKANLRKRRMIDERVSNLLSCTPLLMSFVAWLQTFGGAICIGSGLSVEMIEDHPRRCTKSCSLTQHMYTTLCFSHLQLLAVTKKSWKECRQQKMSAPDCKAFIDGEIFNLFTDRDRYIRSVIMGKRRKTDEHYNAVTIYIGDNDMTEGLFGDGIVTYEL